MELVEMLDHFWDTHEAVEYEDENGMWLNTEEDEEGEKLMDKLYEELFIGGGHWNPPVVQLLSKHGYHCWVGDGDSFGILVACISKDGKTISIG